MKTLSKEDIYKIVIVSFIFVIIVLMTLLEIDKRKRDLGENPNLDAYSVVTNYNIFFFVNKNIDTFINYVSKNNNKAVLNFLDNNENINSVYNKLNLKDENNVNYMAKITKSFTLNNDIIVYYTEGYIYTEGFDGKIIIKNNVKFLLFVDYDKMTCSVRLLDEEITEEELNNLPKDKKIEQNSDNQLKQIDVINSNRICSMYLSDFISKLDNRDTYKIVNNYDNYNDFKNFIDNNDLSSMAKSCNQTINEDGKRVYNIVDSNDYRYTLTENNIFDYTISILKQN